MTMTSADCPEIPETNDLHLQGYRRGVRFAAAPS
jgi:hypothetical protein